MGKSKRKIINWQQYNQALVNRGSVTFWLDGSDINAWHCKAHYSGRGRGFQFSDTAIETALMLKGIFKLSLQATESFINSLFRLMNVPLAAPDYTCIIKRAKTVEVKYRNLCRDPVTHLVVDSTGLKVYGEGEWKTSKHGKTRRRT